jgi:hypothetical protein
MDENDTPRPPERRVALSAEERARLLEGLDVAALEELLGALPDELRPFILSLCSPEADPEAAMR